MNATLAVVVAKAQAAPELNPRLWFGAVLVGGLLLVASAFPSKREHGTSGVSPRPSRSKG